MIVKLIESIAQELIKIYPEYKVIVDKIEQNFSNVIHIHPLPIKVNRVLGERYHTKIRVIFTIFNEDMEELLKLGRELFSILEVVPYGEDRIRGNDYSFSIEDRTGIVKITYNIWEYNVTDKTKMISAKYKGSVKK